MKQVGAGGGFLPITLLEGKGGIWPVGPSFADLCSMIKHLLRTLTQFLTGSFVSFLAVCAGSLQALDPRLVFLVTYHGLEIGSNDGVIMDHCSSLALEVSTPKPLRDRCTWSQGATPLTCGPGRATPCHVHREGHACTRLHMPAHSKQSPSPSAPPATCLRARMGRVIEGPDVFRWTHFPKGTSALCG